MKSTSHFKKNNRGTICLNCKQKISESDNFCTKCGQVNDRNPLSLKQYFSEYLSGFFSFDNRFLKTVIPLLFKPGKVTREYVEGKRRKYVNPFQMFLHITIVFFLIQGIFNTIDELKPGGTNVVNIISEIDSNDAILAFDTINSTSLSNIESQAPGHKNIKDLITLDSSGISDSLKQVINNRAYLNDSLLNIDSQKLDQYLDSLITKSALIEQLNSEEISKPKKDSIFNMLFQDISNYSLKLLEGKEDVTVTNWQQVSQINELKNYSLDQIEKVFKENDIAYTIPVHHRISIEDGIIKKFTGDKFFTRIYDFMEYDSSHKDIDIDTALDDLGYKKSYWNIFYYSKAQNLNKFKDDPEFRKSYADNIISKISVSLFFLLPIFTLVVALLYIRNKYNYTEHLVFVFHVQTVFFILLILTILIDRIFNTDIGILFFFLIFLFYIYKALRNFYKQGRIKTFIKYLILNTFFVIMATIGGIIISFIAFLI